MATSPNLETFCNDALKMGAIDAIVISPKKVFTATWVRLRCQYGCSEYGLCLTCPPHSPAPETTRKMLDEYQSAILLHGDETELLRRLHANWKRKYFWPVIIRPSRFSADRAGYASSVPCSN